MTQQLFDDAIGTPPPSTVDVHSIIRRESLRSVARRAMATLAGVVTLSAALIGGMSLVQTRPAADPPIELLPTISATPVPESAKARANRVSAAWQRATAKVLPGAKWKAWRSFPPQADSYDSKSSPTAPAIVTQTNGNVGRPGPWVTSDRFYYIAALVEVGGVEGKLRFQTCLTSEGAAYFCHFVGECVTDCVEKSGPNGENIKVRRETRIVTGYKVPYVEFTVWITSANGTRSAAITLDNVPGTDSAEPVTTKLPLTEEQIIAILLEPDLMI